MFMPISDAHQRLCQLSHGSSNAVSTLELSLLSMQHQLGKINQNADIKQIFNSN